MEVGVLTLHQLCFGLEPDFTALSRVASLSACRFKCKWAARHPAPLLHRVWKCTQVQLHTSMATPESGTCKKQTCRGKHAGATVCSEPKSDTSFFFEKVQELIKTCYFQRSNREGGGVIKQCIGKNSALTAKADRSAFTRSLIWLIIFANRVGLWALTWSKSEQIYMRQSSFKHRLGKNLRHSG